MATILEALQNAQINLITNRESIFSFSIGESQINMAVALLEKGYPTETDAEDLLAEYETIDRVPDYE